MAEPWVGLAEAISTQSIASRVDWDPAAVRAELTAAMDAGAGERVRFALQPVELELGVQVHTAGRAGGGVKIGVVSVGASGERSSTASHRLTVRLAPVTAATGRRPLISADE